MKKYLLCIALLFLLCVPVKAADISERVKLYKETMGFDEAPEKYIFIGDSRTVGMQMTVGGEEDCWSCKTSMGYDWMVSEGIPAVEGEIGDGVAVFVLLGVNDLGNAAAYAEYVNQKAADWAEAGASTYFVSVGPVGSTTVTNQQIEDFNSVISSNADEYRYLDLYSSMQKDGFSTSDGLHYTSDTYWYIYQFLHDNA